jgi:4-amino-4-deoxy-L-arabinose transferase-like glycosyltransferase
MIKSSITQFVPRIWAQFLYTRTWLAAMAALQVLWLYTIWLLGGAASNHEKIPFLILYTVVIGVVVGWMPATLVSRMSTFKGHVVQHEKLVLLILCLVVLTAGVVYASQQRVLTDEQNVFNASRIVTEQGVVPFFANYGSIPWLGYQHPPLIPMVYGLAMRVFGLHLFVLRCLSLAASIATVVLTYLLGRDLYDRETGFLAATLLLSFLYFLRMGTAALTDMPVTFLFTLSLYSTFRLCRTPMYRLSLAAGAFIGLGLLAKYTMALIYPVLLSYLAISSTFRRLKLHLVTLALVSLGLLAIWLVYIYYSGVLAAQSKTLSSYAGFVTTTSRGKWWMLEMVSTRLTSALGFYNLPLLLLGSWHLLQRRHQSDLLVLLWIATVFPILILTTPDARYFMPTFPALAMAAAGGVRRFCEAAEKLVLLALLYCGGALYLFIGWFRAPYLFLH